MQVEHQSGRKIFQKQTYWINKEKEYTSLASAASAIISIHPLNVAYEENKSRISYTMQECYAVPI